MTRTAVVGAGPTGLYCAIALARRGHEVALVDRDAGPDPDGTWDRAGVMQFRLPHAFRGLVVEALVAEAPDVLDALLAAGAEAVLLPGPDGAERTAGLRCRRMTFEGVLRAAALAEPGVVLRRGHAEEVVAERGRVAGVRVDGDVLAADLVLDASGRAGRLGRGLRAPAEGGDSGVAYVCRQYRLRPGAEPGPMTSPIASVANYPGYQVIVFPHDAGVFTALVVRSAADRALAGLREPAAFTAAVAAIPVLAAWTDPDRSVPHSAVLAGAGLHNTYRGQLDESGRVALPGLLFAGDTVCTTNPAAGRGVAIALTGARRLVELLDEHDAADAAPAFDAWCRGAVRPWFADHVAVDAAQARRWAGEDVDLTGPLPSDLICATVEADPSLLPVVGPYWAMQALPETLGAAEARAREIYASGWRPPVPEGPDRDELAALAASRCATNGTPVA